MASPNWSAIAWQVEKGYYPGGIDKAVEDNKKALQSRIAFIRDVMVAEKIDIAILGAFGCGVFKQNPEVVAECFKEAFKNTGTTCIYAIPGDFHRENLEAFENVFSHYEEPNNAGSK